MLRRSYNGIGAVALASRLIKPISPRVAEKVRDMLEAFISAVHVGSITSGMGATRPGGSKSSSSIIETVFSSAGRSVAILPA